MNLMWSDFCEESNHHFCQDEYLDCEKTASQVDGYNACLMRCEYDKEYSLIDKDGRVFTYLSLIHESDKNEFKHTLYGFCGRCSRSVGIAPIRRTYQRYQYTSNDLFTLKNYRKYISPTPAGRKLVRRFVKSPSWNRSTAVYLSQFKQQKQLFPTTGSSNVKTWLIDTLFLPLLCLPTALINIVFDYSENVSDCIKIVEAIASSAQAINLKK